MRGIARTLLRVSTGALSVTFNLPDDFPRKPRRVGGRHRCWNEHLRLLAPSLYF